MRFVIKQCLAESTMHGLPQLALKKSKCIKILWIFLTFAAFGGFVAHATMLILKYIEQAVSISIIPKGIPFQQPDILICPRKGFALEYVRHPPKKEYKFIKTVSEEMIKIHKDFSDGFNGGPEELLNNIEVWKVFEAFSYRPRQFFLKILCSVYGSFDNLDTLTLETESNKKYIKCFRLTPSKCLIQYPTSKITLFLYVHNYNVDKSSQMPEAERILKNTDYKLTKGIALYFLNPNEYPQDSSEMTILPLGTETEIYIKSTQYNFVNRNNFVCLEDNTVFEYRNLMFQDSMNRTNSFTKSSLCHLNAYCEDVYQVRNCTYTYCPVPVARRQEIEYCYNYSYKEMRPENIYDSFQLNDTRIFKKCKVYQPCSYVDYRISTFQNNLDLEDFMRDNDYFLYSMANDNFPGIKEFYENYENDTWSLPNWRSNFMTVYIHPGEYESTQLNESFVYDLRNLFTDIGGIMGFYIGASILTSFEFYSILHEFLTILWIYVKMRRDLIPQN